MNWSDISESIGKYAPLAATALSSPFGAAIGVGTVIANIFGVKADPKSVSDFIQRNPEKAEERLKFEMGNNLELQKIVSDGIAEKNRHEEEIINLDLEKSKIENETLRIELENLKRASGNKNSPVDDKIKLLSVIYNMVMLVLSSSAFFYIVYENVHFNKVIDAGLCAMLGMMIGQYSSALKDIINYFFGTSLSSKNKDETISFMGKR